MAEEITKTYRHSHSPDVVEVSESSGSTVAIVAIVVILLIALVLAAAYWNNTFGFSGVFVVRESPAPQREIIRESTDIRETNTIIQPEPAQQPVSSPTTETGTPTG